MATVGTDQGFVVSTQLLIAGQRAEIVCPMAFFNDDSPGAETGAFLIAQEWEAEVLPVLVPILSSEASVVGISVEPMDNGGIPYRVNFPIGTFAGTNGASPVPQQVAALVVYYPDPADVSPGSPTNTGMNFIPGLDEADVNAEIISGALQTLLETLAETLVTGFAVGAGGPVLSRSIFAARNAARVLRKAVAFSVRHYVGTIRRRLLPR